MATAGSVKQVSQSGQRGHPTPPQAFATSARPGALGVLKDIQTKLPAKPLGLHHVHASSLAWTCYESEAWLSAPGHSQARPEHLNIRRAPMLTVRTERCRSPLASKSLI